MSERAGSSGGAWKVVLAIATFLFLWFAVFIITDISEYRSTPGPGEIGVVRNGSDPWWLPDWFDNHKIRGIVPNGAGNTGIGLGSEVHYYPVSTQQRFFRMQTCYEKGDNNHSNPQVCEGADGLAIQVPTSDGVEATISGTFYLNTVFNNTQEGEEAVEKFDTQFSTRTFGGKHPYDGTKGWENFLAAIVEPIIQNNMRQTVASIKCSELVSSCALVQNSGSSKKLAAVNTGEADVQKVETGINEHLASDLESTLGEKYFENVQFRLSKVELPPKVQQAIDGAQAAFAQISTAQAAVKKSEYEAEANEVRQDGYNKCRTCAEIDTIKAIPKSIQVWAPGGKAAIAVGSGK